MMDGSDSPMDVAYIRRWREDVTACLDRLLPGVEPRRALRDLLDYGERNAWWHVGRSATPVNVRAASPEAMQCRHRTSAWRP